VLRLLYLLAGDTGSFATTLQLCILVSGQTQDIVTTGEGEGVGKGL
jgi:hypothetical protein